MDSLSAVLREIHLQGSVHFNTCFQSPWGLNIEQSAIASFHLVISGKCWLKIKGINDTIEVNCGDAVILPHGTEHQLYDTFPSICIPAAKAVADIKSGNNPFLGPQMDLNITCGYFKFERNCKHVFVESLPVLIHITKEQRRHYSWLDTAMQLVVSESASEMPGKECFIDRVTELFFIQIIRVHINANKDKRNYFAALADKQLSIAIKLMHESPELQWTLDDLAKRSCMSRARFASKFKELVGMTPILYLTTCRMIKAKRLIGSSNEALDIVAEKVGYLSESSFKAAFKKFYDATPASFREKPAPESI